MGRYLLGGGGPPARLPSEPGLTPVGRSRRSRAEAAVTHRHAPVPSAPSAPGRARTLDTGGVTSEGGAADPDGKLELTWGNKNQRLLSHGVNTYEWVEPTDWRVAEVRLLHEVSTVGDADAGNLLVAGDALHVLTALAKLPELRDTYLGKVRCVYIDPPFNTQQTFSTYDDAVEHSVWLTLLRDRLRQIEKLLAPNGSVWVHVDDYEQHRARCVMDEVFGADKFVATLVWQKRYSRENRPAIGAVHDYIHVYSPAGANWKLHRNRLPRGAAKEYRNPNNDPRGPWRVVPMTAQGFRANQMYEITTPGGAVHVPPKGRCWSCVRETYDQMLADGRIYFGKDGNAQPGILRYLDEDEGLVPWTWWPHDEVGHNDEAKKEILELFPGVSAFDTPKPERLLERILTIATNEGDIVLDCYAGSGTTAAVATKMGRRWVTSEVSEDTVNTYTRPRLEMVVKGEDPGGVTALREWEGGAGFIEASVGESMFTQIDGTVVLADWAVGGALSEAVCAQVGYRHEPDPPFTGIKGRSRLVVLDGMLTTAVADFLLAQLEPNERLLAIAQSLEPGVEDYVREQRPGSRARKVPRDLAHASQLTSRLVHLKPRPDDELPGGTE